jgi:hypothetical protein
LFHDWQTANPRDDREQINNAREAAEALFRPKQSQLPVQAPVASIDAPPLSEQHVPRQPRVFTIAPGGANNEESANVAIESKRKTRRTPSTRGAQTIVIVRP